MIPIKQTVLHDPENGKIGNCLSAVMASLLHLPIEEVPTFHDGDWLVALNTWLRKYELAYVTMNYLDVKTLGIEGCYHELCGLTVRSGEKRVYHACVGKDGYTVFDPHPSNDGLIEPEFIGFFISLNPWKVVDTMK